jgi:ectoine hydroxylase-related dioxygenase (phytanoyl-CoA dioxygenase family)
VAEAPAFAEHFVRDGMLTIERLFDPSLIASVHDEYQRQFPDLSTDARPQHLIVGHRRLQLPIEIRGAVADPMLSAHPLLISMLVALLGSDLAIDSVACVVALPGAKAQHLHRDHDQLFPGAEKLEEQLPTVAVTLAIPLIDLTSETGSTLLHAGSHRMAELADEKAPDLPPARPAYLKRGGCFLMDYGLWHRGMANGSEAARPIIYIVYTRSWFTDGSTNYQKHERLKVNWEMLRAMPLQQRRLYRRATSKGTHDFTPAELLSEDGAGEPQPRGRSNHGGVE